MVKNKLLYFASGAASVIVLAVILNFTYEDAIKSINPFPQSYKIVTPAIPKNLNFCGESVPIYNIEVRERIEREFIVNTYWHSATLLLLKNANRWFPVIEPILKRNGIPDDFKYMSMIESNLTNAVSPAGAVGFWQLMKASADRYKLEVNDEIDERYNVEKSTEAACKYLKESYEKYGNWTMSAGSYNMGINGVSTQMERQKADNYYNLVMNEETSRFVARIISMKYIHQNPENYGFDINESDLYPPFKTKNVVVNYKVEHWADFAKENGINYKTLKYFNPWLRDNFLTNKENKTYEIKIPAQATFKLINESK